MMQKISDLEASKYIVWINNGDGGYVPTTCETWGEVIVTLRGAYGAWIVIRPVIIEEPLED